MVALARLKAPPAHHCALCGLRRCLKFSGLCRSDCTYTRPARALGSGPDISRPQPRRGIVSRIARRASPRCRSSMRARATRRPAQPGSRRAVLCSVLRSSKIFTFRLIDSSCSFDTYPPHGPMQSSTPLLFPSRCPKRYGKNILPLHGALLTGTVADCAHSPCWAKKLCRSQ